MRQTIHQEKHQKILRARWNAFNMWVTRSLGLVTIARQDSNDFVYAQRVHGLIYTAKTIVFFSHVASIHYLRIKGNQ